ncbi:uncharacterized protein LOC143464799 [Clavelina lepadiformis]|uniref:uncharacterized protein LOC143464799 n=1 Tax=Clavelina lepadiformis TaxID=159417 RepID=UPI004042330F
MASFTPCGLSSLVSSNSLSANFSLRQAQFGNVKCGLSITAFPLQTYGSFSANASTPLIRAPHDLPPIRSFSTLFGCFRRFVWLGPQSLPNNIAYYFSEMNASEQLTNHV